MPVLGRGKNNAGRLISLERSLLKESSLRYADGETDVPALHALIKYVVFLFFFSLKILGLGKD